MDCRGNFAGQSADEGGKLRAMKSRRHHKRVRRKKSKLGYIVMGAAVFILLMFALSITAFYSGRYDIIDKVSPPAPVEE